MHNVSRPTVLSLAFLFSVTVFLIPGHCAKSHYAPGTTMPATSKYVLFPGHSHLLTTGTDDQTL